VRLPASPMSTKANQLLTELRASLDVGSLADLRERTVTPDWWESVARAYSNLSDARPEPPTKPPHELRPVFMTSAISDLDEAEVAARSLLLANTVALILPDSINYPRRLLRLATLLEPAIDEGLLLLFPEASFDAGEAYFNAALVRSYSEPIAASEDRVEKARGVARRLEIAGAMDACALFPDRLDLAVTTPPQVSEIRELLELSGLHEGGHGHLDTDRIRFLPDLLSLRIPNVALSAQELIAIRRDGMFESVRAALSEALRRTASLDDDEVVDPAGVRVREIREYLDDAAAAAVAETSRSRVIRTSVTGSVAIGVGCATGALGATGGLEAAALAGGVGSAAGMVLGWLGGRPRSGTKRFRRVVAHLFGDEEVPRKRRG
jgi:hypothetical protein